MTTARDLEYQAQYQKRLRADARASGKSAAERLRAQATWSPRLDGLKTARGLTNRNDALEQVAAGVFRGGESKGTMP
jgi:hypothetical protein